MSKIHRLNSLPSPFSLGKVFTTVFLSFAFLAVLLSFMTVSRFPPMNFDEVAFSSLADTFMRTGRIYYELADGVIHPHFELFARLSNMQTQGVFMLVWGGIQSIIGRGLISERFVSFFLWLLGGGFLFLLSRRFLTLLQSALALCIWSFSFDGILSSHLIRPDTMLALMVIGVLYLSLAFHKRQRLWHWLLIGLLSGFAPGVHNNGLYIIVLATLHLIALQSVHRQKIRLFLWLAVGFVAGFVVQILLADYEYFSASRHGLILGIFQNHAAKWKERLSPINLLGDSVLGFLTPMSFYIKEKFWWKNLWFSSGVGSFFLVLFGVLWGLPMSRNNTFIRTSILSTIFLFFAVGFGHIRPELIYNYPVMIPFFAVLGWLLVSVGQGVWKVGQKAAPLMIVTGCTLFLLCFLFRTSILFFLLLLLIVYFMEGVKDKVLIGVGVGGLFLLLSLWVRSKGAMQALKTLTLSELTSPLGWMCMGLIVIGAAVMAWLYKKRGSKSDDFKRAFPPLVKMTVLIWCLGITSFSSVFHHISLSSQTPHPMKTREALFSLIDDPNARILAPTIFWFYFYDKLKTTGAMRTEYYYTGQKRPWSAIERYRPDILIVDDDFKKKFLSRLDSEKRQRVVLSPSVLLKVPHVKLGQIEKNTHHSQLDVYRLNWESDTKASKPPPP